MAGKSKWVEPVVSLLRAQGQAYSGDICRKLNMKREQFARAVRSSQGRIVEAFPGSRIYKLKEPNDVLDELRRESKPLPGWSSVIHLPPKLHERYVGPDLARFKENQQVRWRGEDPAAHGADFYDMHSDYWPPEFDQLARALEDAREWFTRYARKLVYQSLMAEKQTKRDRKTVDVEINGRHYRVRGSVEGAAAAEVDRLMHGVVIELSLVPMALLEQDRSMKAAIDRLRNQDADRFNAITRKFLIKCTEGDLQEAVEALADDLGVRWSSTALKEDKLRILGFVEQGLDKRNETLRNKAMEAGITLKMEGSSKPWPAPKTEP